MPDKRKRRFGRVRKLPSGRFQARYRGPDGLDHPGPNTFPTKRDADQWLNLVEVDVLRGSWLNPDLGKVPLGEYLTTWIDHRPGLRPRTLDLYRWLYTRYIEPTMSTALLADITPGTVRTWRAHLLSDGISETMAAKAYRLLRAVLNTAVDDEHIRRNPCRIKGAGEERASERPTATIEQVFALADRMPGRYRALVLFAAFTSLRYGELAALRRTNIDPECESVTVTASMIERHGGQLAFGPPKSAAGRRRVTIPGAVRDEIQRHLDTYVPDRPDALIFTGAKGAALRRGNFHKATDWCASTADVGLPGFHFHDLRHTGNTLAAGNGANLADLMARMGHGSMRAAKIYLHTTQLRDTLIAEGLDKEIRKGTDRARNGHEAVRDGG